MNQYYRSATAAAILTLAVAGAWAQTSIAASTASDLAAVPAEVTAAQGLIVKDLRARKEVQIQWDADRAAAISASASGQGSQGGNGGGGGGGRGGGGNIGSNGGGVSHASRSK
jgi:uncharacterized membrane protein YgcG